MDYDPNLIRNFAIVAHIDHGKSTLADRLLEKTGTIEARDMHEQMLDSNPIERERGITIKLAPVRMKYIYQSQAYTLNLIDTPGHVDFSYEVSRSLSACEGIILVVDATSGIQAQTLAHMQLIKNNNLKVIPVINKIDLPSANIDESKKALCDTFGFTESEIIEVSAKKGINIDKVLEEIVLRIPPPVGEAEKNLKALVFSSKYDSHKGVVVYVKIVDGKIGLGRTKELQFMATNAGFIPVEIGVFTPEMKSTGILRAGEVGYVATGLKNISLAQIGDTLCDSGSLVVALPGYKTPQPMVFLSLFPVASDDYQNLREALDKLHLSDCSFTYQPHSSNALGKGFLCGFLGLLHADVIQERLGKEFQVNVITTSPTVEYQIIKTTDEVINVKNPDGFPDPSLIREVEEPVMFTTIYTPANTVGSVMSLCQDKRAEFINLEFFTNQAKLTYIIPLSEMIVDFFDSLKSISSGYASLGYEFYEMRKVEAVKLDILLNHEKVDAFTQIVVRQKMLLMANYMVEKLKNMIPKHLFQIPIQAAISGKIIVRGDIKAYRKDVTAKLYGGDRTRKDKLLEAQKKGKKRLRQFGRVEIPQEVYLGIFKKS